MVRLTEILMVFIVGSCSWLHCAALPKEKIIIHNETNYNLMMQISGVTKDQQGRSFSVSTPHITRLVRKGEVFSIESQIPGVISFVKEGMVAGNFFTDELFQKCRAAKFFNMSIMKGRTKQGGDGFFLELGNVPHTLNTPAATSVHPLSTPAARNVHQHQTEVELKKAQAAELNAVKAELEEEKKKNKALSTVLAQFDPGNPLLENNK